MATNPFLIIPIESILKGVETALDAELAPSMRLIQVAQFKPAISGALNLIKFGRTADSLGGVSIAKALAAVDSLTSGSSSGLNTNDITLDHIAKVNATYDALEARANALVERLKKF